MNEIVVNLNGNNQCQFLFVLSLKKSYLYNNYEPEDHQAEQENSC